MTTHRIHAQNPSIGSATLEHTNTPAPTARANGTHGAQRTSSSRGPDVIAESGSPTSAQTRLRAMQQRASVTGSATAGPALQANGFEAMVRDYRNQMIAGRTPTAPSAPALPHMSGREIIERAGIQHPDFARTLRQAEHDAHANQAFSPLHWAFEHAFEGVAHRMGLGEQTTGALTEIAWHSSLEANELGVAMMGAHSGSAAALAAIGFVAAMADAESQLIQEIVHTARGHAPPSAAVREALAHEIPRRVAAWMRDQSVRAEASFSAGARRAAQGLAPETSRLGDRAYMLGVEQGNAYRATNGDAYSRVVQHNRAIEQAAREVMAMPHAAPTDHIVPLTQQARDHVGVDIHIDG